MDTNRYMSITVQALVKQCVNCGTKEAVSHYAKVQRCFVQCENGAKVAKFAKNFDIPTTTLTSVSKN